MTRRRLEYLIDERENDSDEEYGQEYKKTTSRWLKERATYFEDYDDSDFVTHFRLSKTSALSVLSMIEHNLEFTTNRNQAVSPINQLLLALRFYATGGDQLSVADYAGVSQSTASRIVHRVSSAIAALRCQYINLPQTPQSVLQTQMRFYNIARFPKVIGAMDCTHIRIRSPGGNNAELFRNRKTYFSLNVQAICNANMEFSDIVARWPGSSHDSTIFNNCVQRDSGRQHSLKCAKGKRSRPLCPVVQQEEVESIPTSSYDCTIVQSVLRGLETLTPGCSVLTTTGLGKQEGFGIERVASAACLCG
ncbi:hypothetical protein ANN_09345 [Periplaneta americana]|uniref:Putative nuclease HARBI1 n=1 Tax=Periplaneta americana TaxID=6978 RepID=A0ABQ8TL39_PERAM|nr:hypothetical protein ANN_09345 [Periplaneta americana]